MADKKVNHSLIMCIISCVIPLGCYGLERIVFFEDLGNKTVSLVLALSFVALTGLIYFIISKIENPFYGLIASILAFKLMPPEIVNLMGNSFEGQAVYSLVQMAALLLFGALIVKHFKAKKNSDTPIDALPIIAIIFVMLMFRDPGLSLYSSIYYLCDQSLIGPYIAQAIVYLWAIAVIYVLTVKSNKETINFVATFEIVAMVINIFRRLGTVVVHLINGTHISMSYYCWIAIYFVVMLVFGLLKRKNAQKS